MRTDNNKQYYNPKNKTKQKKQPAPTTLVLVLLLLLQLINLFKRVLNYNRTAKPFL
jgi:hypothetical protein